MCSNVWIGLANVVPYKSTEYDFDGAYVNVLCLADNFDDFYLKISKTLDEESLRLINIEDAELFENRSGKFYLDKSLLGLAEEASIKGTVCFSTFHAYDSEGEK